MDEFLVSGFALTNSNGAAFIDIWISLMSGSPLNTMHEFD